MKILHIKKTMKLAFNLSLFLFALFSFNIKTFSLSYYKIKKICQKEKNEFICIKNLQEKKSNLQKGHKIEIPVIRFRR